jgi:predicted metal-binding membrane protein
MGLAGDRRRHGNECGRDDRDGRNEWLAHAAGSVDASLRGADLRHVVGNDGGDDAAQRRSDAPPVRPCNRKDKKAGAPLVPIVLFAAGYLLVWGGFCAIATALQWGLESARLLSPMLVTTNKWLGAGILIAAGLSQFTPLKAICLRHCRTPLGFLLGSWRPGRLGALRMGLEHGAFCLGCCWFLMALLFFGGVMNLYWIAGLAVFVLLEKTIPLGHWLGRVAGVVLVAWGGALAI